MSSEAASRPEDAVISELGPVLDRFRRHHPHESDTLIHRAYDVAAAAHEGQFRKTGEPYITHPLAVASMLADVRAGRRHRGGGPPPRHRGGHRHHPRRRGARVRQDRGLSHRRGHQARSGAVLQPGGPAGGHDPQDGHRHGPRRAGAAHQARRSPAQHPHHLPAVAGEAAAHRRWRPSRCTPRWRIASGSRRSSTRWRTGASPSSIPGATPRSWS